MPTVTPGVNILDTGTVTPQGAPTDTGVIFAGILAGFGRTDAPVKCRSLADYVANFGPRVSYGFGYDFADYVFNEAGGGTIYFLRAVGPAATKDTVTFSNVTPAAVLAVDAIGEGTSGLSAQVIAGTGGLAANFKLVITGLPSGGTLTSPDLATVTDAINWAATTNVIRVRNLGGALPLVAAGPTALAGGADDRTNVTDTVRTAQVAKILPALGPGQVCWPGATTEAIYVALANHAVANNRFAVCDLPDTNNDATLESAVTTFQADAGLTAPTNITRGRTYFAADWDQMPGLTPTTIRTVPPSAHACAVMARSDRLHGNPNRAPSGSNGRLSYAIGRTQPDWTDAQITSLVAAGANPTRTVPGYGLEVYGARTAADPNNDPVYVMVGASRLRMAILAKGRNIGEAHQSKQLDGNKLELGAYKGDLTGMLMDYYRLGALYPTTPGDPTTAFVVDTGDDVNTPTTLQARQEWANIGIRPSPFAETVFISLAAYPITQPF